MYGKTTTTWDIILFLNVINGPFILHCKELPRLRFCLAIFISIAIKYCCRRFFIVHRIPFILPVLGSLSSLFDFNEQANITNTNKIQSISLFRLLIALEQTSVDAMREHYSILVLVKDNL
ncbi:unnamed protein product [Adineta steineri]|uniref:Protein UNC80 C-terminal domain-containing protein n=1 Tax=Adineta steineri TaxID=433720 RepID=A0A820LIV8_9BILA|nr:unnamed protein product [Adineta steineri]